MDLYFADKAHSKTCSFKYNRDKRWYDFFFKEENKREDNRNILLIKEKAISWGYTEEITKEIYDAIMEDE